MGINESLDKLTENPGRVFFIDALGALLTFIGLAAVLIPWERYFGMPQEVLVPLAATVFCFFIFSINCLKFVRENWKPCLGIIMVSNTIYGCISLIMLILHSQILTALGWTYFILELIIIALVVILEYKTYARQP